MTSQNYYSIISSPEIIGNLQELAFDFSLVEMTESERLESPADVFDAPLSPELAQQALELITVAFKTGAAAIAFFTALKVYLATHNTRALVKDAQSSEDKGVLDKTTSDQQIREIVGS